jgi:AcrR family transcriptional regulator
MAQKSDARQKIIDSAFELFTTYSYNTVSIDKIIKKADVSKGGLFHYFNTKYELALEALLNKTEEIWLVPLNDMDKIKEPHMKLKKIIDHSIDIIIENRNLIKFFIDLHQETKNHRNENEKWKDFLNRYIMILSELFKECNIPNPQTKAIILLVSLDSVGMEMIHFPEMKKNIDRKLLKREFYDLFVGNYIKLSNRGK